MRMDEAPVQNLLLSESGLAADDWLTWFSGVGDALEGEWSSERRSFEYSGAVTAPSEQRVIFLGKVVHTTIIWANGLESTGGSLRLPFTQRGTTLLPLRWQTGVLRLWAGTTLLAAATVSGSVITLPDVAVSGAQVVLEGMLVPQRQE